MSTSCRLPGLLCRRWSALVFNQSRCSHVFVCTASRLRAPGVFSQLKAKALPTTLLVHPVRVLSTQEEKPKETSIFSTQRVKMVMKQYGPVAVVFHTVISLCSLGSFYLLVKSGLDVPLLLSKIGISLNQTSSGLSTFGIAYLCHKVLMPLRCFVTISCVPLLVRSFRRRGWMKGRAEEPSSN